MTHLTHRMEALDPRSEAEGAFWEVGFEQSQINSLLHADGTVNDRARLYKIQLASEVVKEPLAVFENWKRNSGDPEHEDGLCYCGKPACNYLGPGKQVPAPGGMVFLVYVTRSGKVSDWRWERASSADPELPEDYENRFGERIWPRQFR